MLARKVKNFYCNSGSVLTNNNSTFTVDNNLDVENFTHVSCSKISLPVSYYSIDSINCTFSLKEGATTVLITIPSSDYGVLNYQSFATVMAGYLNTNSPNGYTYTITSRNDLSQVQNAKFTYSCSNTVNTVSLIFSNNSISQIFGFDYDSTNTFSSGSLTSTQPFNFSPQNTIFVHSSLVLTTNNDSNFSDILATCFVSGNVIFSPFSYQNNDIVNTCKTLDRKTNKQWTFTLTDEEGTAIYLNSLNFSMELVFLELIDVYTMAKEFIDKTLYFYKWAIMKADPESVDKYLQEGK